MLTVRPAAEADAYALWLWANDQETRAASFGRAPIPWDEHRSWLRQALADASRVTLISVSQQGQPVGSIRFDTSDAWRTARLSYVIAPEMRGRGLSTPMVSAGMDWIRSFQPGAVIWAEVIRSNIRSLRVFRRLGWQEEVDKAGKVCFWLGKETA